MSWRPADPCSMLLSPTTSRSATSWHLQPLSCLPPPAALLGRPRSPTAPTVVTASPPPLWSSTTHTSLHTRARCIHIHSEGHDASEQRCGPHKRCGLPARNAGGTCVAAWRRLLGPQLGGGARCLVPPLASRPLVARRRRHAGLPRLPHTLLGPKVVASPRPGASLQQLWPSGGPRPRCAVLPCTQQPPAPARHAHLPLPPSTSPSANRSLLPSAVTGCGGPPAASCCTYKRWSLRRRRRREPPQPVSGDF